MTSMPPSTPGPPEPPPPGPGKSARFPGATFEYWGDAPERCLRCNGPWRRVQTGLTCVVCGHAVVVAQALEQAMGLDRWLNAPDSPPITWKRRRSKPRVLSGTIKRTGKDPQ
jgi:hypothetical protein